MYGNDTDTPECSVELDQSATVAPSPIEAGYHHCSISTVMGKTWRVNVRTMLLPSEHFVSPRNRKVTLVGSTSLLILPPGSMPVVTWTNFTCFTRREKDAHACPTASVQKLVQCFCLVSFRVLVSLLVRAARCCCVSGSVGAFVLPSLSPFSAEGLG